MANIFKSRNKKKKPESDPKSRKKLTSRIVVIFFISAWMFVLGVFVGRGTAPVHFDIEKLQKELADLRKELIQKEKVRFKIDTGSEYKDQNFGFYEALKETDKKTETTEPVPAKKSTKQPKKKAAGQPEKQTLKQPVEKTAPQAEKALAIKKKDRPASLKPNKIETQQKKLTIQVAAVKELKAALSLVDKLQQKGYPAYQVRVQIPDKGTWYRVRIGSFATPSAAGETMNRLKKDTYKPIIVSTHP